MTHQKSVFIDGCVLTDAEICIQFEKNGGDHGR